MSKYIEGIKDVRQKQANLLSFDNLWQKGEIRENLRELTEALTSGSDINASVVARIQT